MAKWQNAKGASRHLDLMCNCSTWSHMSWPYQSTKWFVPFQVVFEKLDSVLTREVLAQKNVASKCIQVYVLRNVATTSRKLYALMMSHTHFRVNLHYRCVIWSLNDCDRIRIHKHLVCKRTLNYFTKLAKRLNN